MYAVMWSEHCSYKSSRAHLGRFPTEAPWVLVGPGEGAGVVDIGDGIAVAVRIESHNHPSAVEPYQGAATGVGGIIRDIFSMGARPIALMDPLRFGTLDDARTRYLFEGVVSGHQRLRQLGRRADRRRRGRVRRHVPRQPARQRAVPRHPAHGAARARPGRGRRQPRGAARLARPAATASAARACSRRPASKRASEVKRPSVQVGDPFEEKRLIEACLELLDRRLAVGVQDLGAAGLSCAASETAAKGGVGMDVDVARVAKREPGHEPGRGADVREPGADARDRRARAARRGARARGAEWEIRATVVGRVTDTGSLPRVRRAVRRDRGARREPVAADRRRRAVVLSSDRRADRRRARRQSRRRSDATTGRSCGPPRRTSSRPTTRRRKLRAKFGAGADLGDELLALLATPTIADKTWVSRQYDHQLFLNTVAGPGADAAVLRVKGTSKALALATDGKARFCQLDPRTGGAARRARSRAQRRDAGCPPARARQLPQLRQPRAPRGDVAVRGSRRGHQRGVRSARHPGDRRQRLLLQRVAAAPTSIRRRSSVCSVSSTSSTPRRPRARLESGDVDRRARRDPAGARRLRVGRGRARRDGGMPPDRRPRRSERRCTSSSPTSSRAHEVDRRARRQRRRPRGRVERDGVRGRGRVPRRSRDRDGLHRGGSVLRRVGVARRGVGRPGARRRRARSGSGGGRSRAGDRHRRRRSAASPTTRSTSREQTRTGAWRDALPRLMAGA